MRRLLEYQADQIERVLYSHRVPCRVLGGVVTPRWVRFEVAPALGARVSQVTRLSEEIALWLGSRGVRVQRQGSRVHIEVPREEGEMVHLLSLVSRLGEMPRQTAVLGLDDAGVPLLLGSWWGLLVSPLLVLVLAFRAVMEERMLRAGLEGYADYAERVRYRFVPHLW